MIRINEAIALQSNQVYLEFLAGDREQAWQRSQNYSNDSSRWNAYLNRLCLNTLIPWIQEESNLPIFPKNLPNLEIDNIWEMVNGTVITLNETRIAIIPSEAIDRSEFAVPSEWVDIPSWAADYYLAVQVNPDDLWLQVWGFTTHSQLKCQENYDPVHRNYTIERDDSIQNFNAFWVWLEMGNNEEKKLAEMPNLSRTEAENLIDRLSQTSCYSPRLEVEFEKWAAMLENNIYRQQLYERRILNARTSVSTEIVTQVPQKLVNLSQWFENAIETGWQTVEELFGAGGLNLAFSMRSGSQSKENDADRDAIAALIQQIYGGKTEHQRKQAAERLGEIGNGNREAIAALIHLIRTTEDEETRWTAAGSLWAIDPANPAAGVKRVIDLGMQLAGHAVALMVAVLEKSAGKVAVLLRVYPMKNQIYLPPNLELVVLDEEGETFLDAQARNADNLIQLKFSGSRGERFSVRVALGDAEITQDFAI